MKYSKGPLKQITEVEVMEEALKAVKTGKARQDRREYIIINNNNYCPSDHCE